MAYTKAQSTGRSDKIHKARPFNSDEREMARLGKKTGVKPGTVGKVVAAKNSARTGKRAEYLNSTNPRSSTRVGLDPRRP